MKQLRVNEILDVLKSEGINLSERNFFYYQREGLIPKPEEKRVGKKGRGVYGLHDASVINLIKEIFRLKDKGYSLEGIKAEFESRIADRCVKIINKWGAESYFLFSLNDFSPFITNEQGLVLQGSETFKEEKGIRERFLLNVHQWQGVDTDERIESFVLQQISNRVDAVKKGLAIALNELVESAGVTKKVFDRILRKRVEAAELEFRVNARLAEIHMKYKGMTKAMWESNISDLRNASSFL